MVDFNSDSDDLSEPEWKRIPLQRLDIECQLATDKGKYCLIVDKSDQAAVFFSYKKNLKEFHKDVIAV